MVAASKRLHQPNKIWVFACKIINKGIFRLIACRISCFLQSDRVSIEMIAALHAFSSIHSGYPYLVGSPPFQFWFSLFNFKVACKFYNTSIIGALKWTYCYFIKPSNGVFDALVTLYSIVLSCSFRFLIQLYLHLMLRNNTCRSYTMSIHSWWSH